MIVRSAAEIQSLDDELNLFEENEWDFMSVVDSRGSNYEYFNDIRDSDFEVKKFKFREALVYISAAAAVIAAMFVVTIKVANPFDDSEYRALMNMQSVHGGATVTYVEGGTEAAPEDLIAVSNTLTGYASCLNAKQDYKALSTYCIDNSKFQTKYYESVNAVDTIYDINDCFARGLREFGGMYQLGRINRVTVKDDIYYCYAQYSHPSIYDVSEFVQSHSQSFMLKFGSGADINEETVAKFLLEVIDEDRALIPTTSGELCIQLKKVDGYMRLVDDSFILNACSDDYSVAVNQSLTSLNSLLTGTRE